VQKFFHNKPPPISVDDSINTGVFSFSTTFWSFQPHEKSSLLRRGRLRRLRRVRAKPRRWQ
jgi:hypothetical protein